MEYASPCDFAFLWPMKDIMQLMVTYINGQMGALGSSKCWPRWYLLVWEKMVVANALMTLWFMPFTTANPFSFIVMFWKRNLTTFLWGSVGKGEWKKGDVACHRYESDAILGGVTQPNWSYRTRGSRNIEGVGILILAGVVDWISRFSCPHMGECYRIILVVGIHCG